MRLSIERSTTRRLAGVSWLIGAVLGLGVLGGCEQSEREQRVEVAEEIAEANAEVEAARRGEHELAQEARGDLAERDIDRLAELQEDMAGIEAERLGPPEHF